jgi:hypothetical protein
MGAIAAGGRAAVARHCPRLQAQQCFEARVKSPLFVREKKFSCLFRAEEFFRI